MRMIFKTNLDLCNEQWPVDFPVIPRVGELVQSKTKHDSGFRLSLQVVRVEYEFNDIAFGWIPVVELHLSNFHKGLGSHREGVPIGSITAFYEWYAPLVGKPVSDFII